MSEAITISRSPTTGTDLVYSPDDGRYYFEQFATLSGKTRVSEKLFSTAEEAKAALRAGTVRWEKWS